MTHWDVSAVVLVLMLFTKWGPSNNQNVTDGRTDGHKMVPIRALIAKKLNYFTTSLQGKNEVEVKFENSMHDYNASLVH